MARAGYVGRIQLEKVLGFDAGTLTGCKIVIWCRRSGRERAILSDAPLLVVALLGWREGGVLGTVTSIQYTGEQGFGAREEPHLVVLVSGSS